MIEQWQELRDEGMARVERASSQADKVAVKWAIVDCCRNYNWFTSDDVMNILTERNIELRDARVLGPLFLQAAKKNVIRPVMCDACDTQRTIPSKRRHGTPQNVWEATEEWRKRAWNRAAVNY